MADPTQEDEAITTALSSRRIPHSRSKANQHSSGRGKGSGGSGGTTTFNPLRTFGHYEVQLGSNSRRAKQKHKDESKSTNQSWLEIHALTENEDGLIGTFNFEHGKGRVRGMCVLAGSRKGLNKIVEGMEHEASSESEDDVENDDENENEDGVESRIEIQDRSTKDPNDEDEHRGSDDETTDEDDNDNNSLNSNPNHLLSASSPAQAAAPQTKARFSSFEKNTFRNPKFWIRWRGHVHTHTSPPPSNDDTEPQTNIETDTGYMIFTSNASEKFDGTMSCQGLEWDNVKMTGWRTRARGTPCPVRWTDFV